MSRKRWHPSLRTTWSFRPGAGSEETRKNDAPSPVENWDSPMLMGGRETLRVGYNFNREQGNAVFDKRGRLYTADLHALMHSSLVAPFISNHCQMSRHNCARYITAIVLLSGSIDDVHSGSPSLTPLLASPGRPTGVNFTQCSAQNKTQPAGFYIQSHSVSPASKTRDRKIPSLSFLSPI